jgi:hypothetical protein
MPLCLFFSMANTLAGAAFGPAVLAPLTRYLHFARQPDGPAETGLPCPDSAFRPRPAGSPGFLATFSAADCLPKSGPGLLLSFHAWF